MKRFQLLTTAIFLFCTLLIAGCTGRGVEAQTRPGGDADCNDEHSGRHPDR